MNQISLLNPQNNISITIDNEQINEVQSTKFLGIQIDQHLTWTEHLNNIATKMAKGIGILWKAKPYLNQCTLRTLCYCFVFPYVNYCNIVWLNTNTFKLSNIITLQKRAVRIVSNADYLAHTSELFTRDKTLKLKQINVLQTAIFMYNLNKGDVPACFNNMFTANNNTHRYNTRFGNNLCVPKHNTNIIKQTLKFTGTKVWNEIPQEIKNFHSTYIFKAKMKKLLFSI